MTPPEPAVVGNAAKPSNLPLGHAPALVESTSSPPVRSAAASATAGTLSHRSSFAENLRSHPPSPRAQRHPSFTQAAVQELMNTTPKKSKDSRFSGRDWRQIRVGELVSPNDVRFVTSDTAVEDATKLLIDAGVPNVILIQDSSDEIASGSYDYNDLTAYLLVVLGLANPDEDKVGLYTQIAKKARDGIKIPLKDIAILARKAPLVSLPESEDLSKAIEIFASGVHRILIVQENKVIGVLSQLRLVNFLWENGSSFPVIDQLYPVLLRDLQIGTHHAISINGDKPLTDALLLLNAEGLTSLAVVDNAQNVIGNISTVDVKHLTTTGSLPLLNSSCIHFISVILSERGVESGKDSFPVFHVSQYSTLAHTVAKLCATRAHRMWLTESPSPSHSLPATPAAAPAVLVSPFGSSPASPSLSSAFPSVSAAAFPGASISGRLIGVISLTDVLNLFARRSGLSPSDPNEQRQQRRRSSSSSLRPSLDSISRSSIDLRR